MLKHVGRCFGRGFFFLRRVKRAIFKRLEKGMHEEGYFPVIAVNNVGESKKLMVSLSYLTFPPFLKLLEKAEEEFGFEQRGVLVVPCDANELQRILFR